MLNRRERKSGGTAAGFSSGSSLFCFVLLRTYLIRDIHPCSLEDPACHLSWGDGN